MSKVAVVGGGAAGMFAAIFAAKNGNEVHLFEKNEKLGKKLFITGKGRCNVTNAAERHTSRHTIQPSLWLLSSPDARTTSRKLPNFWTSAAQ